MGWVRKKSRRPMKFEEVKRHLLSDKDKIIYDIQTRQREINAIKRGGGDTRRLESEKRRLENKLDHFGEVPGEDDYW